MCVGAHLTLQHTFSNNRCLFVTRKNRKGSVLSHKCGQHEQLRMKHFQGTTRVDIEQRLFEMHLAMTPIPQPLPAPKCCACAVVCILLKMAKPTLFWGRWRGWKKNYSRYSCPNSLYDKGYDLDHCTVWKQEPLIFFMLTSQTFCEIAKVKKTFPSLT